MTEVTEVTEATRVSGLLVDGARLALWLRLPSVPICPAMIVECSGSAVSRDVVSGQRSHVVPGTET